MTREEYLKKWSDERNRIYNSIINDVSKKIESVDIYERCDLNKEQSFLMTSNYSEIHIIRDLEDRYPFLTFELSKENSHISWELKEKQ